MGDEDCLRLQQRIAELEDAVKRERHRADLYQSQLEHFLEQQAHAQQLHVQHAEHAQRMQHPQQQQQQQRHSRTHSHHRTHVLAEEATSGHKGGLEEDVGDEPAHVCSGAPGTNGGPGSAPCKSGRCVHRHSGSGGNGGLVHGVPKRTLSCSAGTLLRAAQRAQQHAEHAVPDGVAGAGAGGGGYVTITRKEYDLLQLKERAINVLQEGITIADCSLPDMPLIFANAGFARITGHSVKNSIGRNCRFLQGEGTDPATLRELREAISHGRACVVQLINYKKNGNPFVNYLSVTPIRNAAGQLTHYVGIQSDITELVNHRKAELAAKHAALQAAAATEAKSEFLARMSHEIRTPLNGMIAVGQLLAETSLSPAQWDLVNTIRCSGETLLVLITDILDFSRIEANKMVLNHSVFKLETVMEAAMEIAGLRAAQKRLQVAYHISDNTPRVLLGDAQRLQQILLNILNNAVKFTEEGQVLLEVWAAEPPAMPLHRTTSSGVGPGAAAAAAGAAEALRPTAAAAAAPPPPPCVPASPAAPAPPGPRVSLCFRVRDTGIGISSSDLGRLFSSFTQVDTSPTRRYGGSGLGLAISKKLCNAMDGDMWVESPGLGCGTTFHWTVVVRAPSVAVVQKQHKLRRRSAMYPMTKPQWARMAEAVGAAFLGSNGHSDDSDAGGLGSYPSDLGGSSVSVAQELMAGYTSCSALPDEPLASDGEVGALFGGSEFRSLPYVEPHSTAGLLQELSDAVAARQRETRRAAAAAGRRSGAGNAGITGAVAAAPPPPVVPPGPAGDPELLALERGARAAATDGEAAAAASTSSGPPAAAPRRGPSRNPGQRRRPCASRSFTALHGLQSPLGLGAGVFGRGPQGAAAAAALAHAADNVNPLLKGKKVLLVEPCSMIRQVLMLALQSWGCQVCAVSSQQAAIQQMVDAGTLPPEDELASSAWHDAAAAASPPANAQSSSEHSQHGGSSGGDSGGHHHHHQQQHQNQHPLRPMAVNGFGKGVGGGVRGSASQQQFLFEQQQQQQQGQHGQAGPSPARELSLRCSPDIDESRFKCKGPYDIVMMDMTFTRVLRAITECSAAEAQRLVFMGWPGQNELDSTEADDAMWRHHQPTPGAEHESAVIDLPDPVKSVADRPGSRQLGYVIVTRPVKQGRLMLALEEVLAMQLDDMPLTDASPSCGVTGPGGASSSKTGSDEDGTGASGAAGEGTSHGGGNRSETPRSHHTDPNPLLGSNPNLTKCMLAGASNSGGGTGNGNGEITPTREGSSTSSRLLSLGDGECYNGGGHSASGGQLSLGNSTLRQATVVKKSPSGPDLAEQAASASSSQPLRILLAEDNMINMKVALGILKRIGHQDVVTAENGREALRAVEAHGGAFHLILMDLHMPIMGGMEAVRELKRRFPDCPAKVVAVTADAFEVTRDDCMAAGFDGWLPKPFRVEDLVKIIGDHTSALAAAAAAKGASS